MKKLFWMRLAIGFAVLVWAGSWSISGALEHGWARRSLLSRLSAGFGRPVEVGHFGFSLLGGPTLEADSVSVFEDPHFGQEYFLRAEQLTAGLRWTALLRGKVEFGSLSLTHPSLNLVHTADGHWNIESWLPTARPASVRATAGGVDSIGAPAAARSAVAAAAATERLRHIDVDGGRINFKRGADKLPFALVEVSGRLDQDPSGRWTIDLTADPMRTSVALQEAGTLRLRGTIAGTSERLSPAALTLSWDKASVADAMRLSTGHDYGIRGMLAAEITAKIERAAPLDEGKLGAQWALSGTVRIAGVHRWDLAGRAANPAVNVGFAASWRPGERQVQISRWSVTSPHSRIEAVGAVEWSNGFHPRVQIVSSHIAFDDLLAWRTAFEAGVIADGLAIDGAVGITATMVDWPPHIEQADIASDGAVIRSAGTPAPLEVGPITGSMKRDTLVMAPVPITMPGAPAKQPERSSRGAAGVSPQPQAAGSILVEAALGPMRAGVWPRDWEYRITASGETERTQDILAVAGTFWPSDKASASRAAIANQLSDQISGPVSDPVLGQIPADGTDQSTDGRARQGAHGGADQHPIAKPAGGSAQFLTIASTADWIANWSKDWYVSGPSTLRFVWAGALHPETTTTNGTLELRGLRLNSAMLNQSIVLTGKVELHPGDRRVTIASAEGFGAHWKGTLRSRANEGWTFDLSADHLDAEELDRWLGPRARPSFLARMFPFAAGRAEAAPRDAAIERLNARGRLRVANIGLSSLRIEKLEADAQLRGRNLVLRGAQASFYGGHIAGEFEARLSPEPAYSFHARIERANLAALAAATGSMTGRFGGFASGDLQLAARGVGREDLVKSLEGEGMLRVREPVVNELLPAGRDAGADTANVADTEGPGEGRFGATNASFHIANGKIRVDPFLLTGRDEQFEVKGDVDFSRHLNLRVQSMSRSSDPLGDVEDAPHDEWVGAGTVEAPQWTRQTRLAGTANGAIARHPSR